jgi:hypothetical protein
MTYFLLISKRWRQLACHSWATARHQRVASRLEVHRMRGETTHTRILDSSIPYDVNISLMQSRFEGNAVHKRAEQLHTSMSLVVASDDASVCVSETIARCGQQLLTRGHWLPEFICGLVFSSDASRYGRIFICVWPRFAVCVDTCLYGAHG